jgi:hypothetical protein
MDKLEEIVDAGKQVIIQATMQQLAEPFNSLYVNQQKGPLKLIITGTNHLEHYMLSDIIAQYHQTANLASITLWDFKKRLGKSAQHELNHCYNHLKEKMGNISMEVVKGHNGSTGPIQRLQHCVTYEAHNSPQNVLLLRHIYSEKTWQDDVGTSLYSKKELHADKKLDRLYQFAQWCDKDFKRF